MSLSPILETWFILPLKRWEKGRGCEHSVCTWEIVFLLPEETFYILTAIFNNIKIVITQENQSLTV